MTLTENYGLKKPDLIDPVDVSVLNENLESIDKALVEKQDGCYVLDLREAGALEVPTADVLEAALQVTDEHTDLAALIAAVDAGKAVELLFLHANDTLGNVSNRVILDNREIPTVTDVINVDRICGIYANFVYPWITYSAALNIDRTNNEVWLQLTLVSPRTEEEDTDPTATTIAVVRADNTITITTTFEDESQSASEITLGSDDYPEKVTTDGAECAVTWEGF